MEGVICSLGGGVCCGLDGETAGGVTVGDLMLFIAALYISAPFEEENAEAPLEPLSETTESDRLRLLAAAAR